MKEFKEYREATNQLALKITEQTFGHSTEEVLSAIGLVLKVACEVAPEQRQIVLDFVRFLPNAIELFTPTGGDKVKAKDEVN